MSPKRTPNPGPKSVNFTPPMLKVTESPNMRRKSYCRNPQFMDEENAEGQEPEEPKTPTQPTLRDFFKDGGLFKF